MRKVFLLLTALFLLSAYTFQRGNKIPDYDIPYIEKNLCLIPAGSFHMGSSDQDIPVFPYRMSMTVTIAEFYMFNQEVSNRFYLWFIYDMKLRGDTTMYKKVLPDTLVWRSGSASNEPYVEYYFRHPAYAQYPVVGVTYDQCMLFCEWLTARYNAYPKRKFKKVLFDLPDSTQWEYAARGGAELLPFPWKGYAMRNEKGDWMANFRPMSQSGIMRKEFEKTNSQGVKYMETYYVTRGGEDYMGVAGTFSDAADITAPVHSYWPNAFGLYNMAGNVEEFVKNEGLTKGGSWRDPGFYLQNAVSEKYDPAQSANTERGFRFIMKVIEP